MNPFWRIVGFEYRKMFHKKSMILGLVLAFILSLINGWGILIGNYYINGEVFESHYDAMIKDRAYARSLAGRPVNTELILAASQAYAQIPGSAQYQNTEAYQTFARPYSEIYSLTRTIYNTESRRFNMEDFQKLTDKQAGDFYSIREERMVQVVEQTRMSEKAKKEVLALDNRVQTPFIYSYIDGYTRFFTMMYITGLIAAFFTAVCMAPLFSGEYACRADQLILTSKHGKGQLIGAKLFTGFTAASGLAITFTLISYLQCMLTFGFDGGNTPLQLYMPMCSYPLTMGQTAVLLSASVLCACLFTAAVTMLLSARFRSPFAVIVLAGLLLLAPMFVTVSEANTLLYNLVRLLPTNMMVFKNVTSMIQYELPGLVLRPYVFLPLFGVLASVLLIPRTFRSFRNHQIT
ncbi:ABC transporter permease [Paenibacillus sp. YN15]|uniref:ABC transporter permease n=1 Tax=Paenibacillus sp. YN15 TaxID=1742774 RepID=UPI000DCEFF36|nr:ABC transporter permease [Paenibacillus sp. YN15]RAV01199.1 ABC transporter permease [Paenibacillus sp. YN15]